MDKFNFEWELEYEGVWEFPSCCNPICGKLSLADGRLTIELTGDIGDESKSVHIPSLSGKVHGKNNGKAVYIKLLNLNRIKTMNFLWSGTKVYTYNATDVFLSECKESFAAPIKAVSINSFLLSKWACTCNHDSISSLFDWGSIALAYPIQETCDEHFQPRSSSIPMAFSHYGDLPTKWFLDIKFNEKKNDFFDAKSFVGRILNLFCLLSQAPIDLGYYFYSTDNGTFAHWNSQKHHYYLLEKTFGVSHNFSSITNESMTAMIERWIAFYRDYTNSIDTFFDSFERQFLPAGQRLKTYMSVIDGITEKYELVGDGQTNDSKKKGELKGILDKVKEEKCLSSIEYNKLTRFVFYEPNNSLGNRFGYLLTSLQDLLPDRLDNAWGYTCTYTRHELTHVESEQTDVFSPYEYPKVVLDLETVICAYLLRSIEADESLIRRTLHLPCK